MFYVLIKTVFTEVAYISKIYANENISEQWSMWCLRNIIVSVLALFIIAYLKNMEVGWLLIVWLSCDIK